jgi:serine/threonine-protein kinase
MLEPPSQAGSLGRIDHYHIRAIVGWGGMGVVLQAYDESLGRTVALKILHPHLAAHGAARRRFAREARAAAAVNHPSVVPIHSVQAESHPPYLVMAYVPGGSLQDRIDREGPLETTDLLRIGVQIADALAAAHAQGLVHRDVKPGNILLDHGQNRVLLSDFGLAQALDDATLTASGAIAGTPQYMSPEQARGEAVDARSDLFSLGGVLYAMASGRPPFRASSTLAVLQKIGTAAPKPLCEIVPEAPPWLQTLIDRLQAKQPAERPQSASEVADWLRQCLAHARRPQEEPLPSALLPAKPLAKPEPVAPARRWLPLAALLPLLIVISGAGWWLWSRRGEDSVRTERVSGPPSSKMREPIRFTPLPSDPTTWDDGLGQAFSELNEVFDRLD